MEWFSRVTLWSVWAGPARGAALSDGPSRCHQESLWDPAQGTGGTRVSSNGFTYTNNHGSKWIIPTPFHYLHHYDNIPMLTVAPVRLMANIIILRPFVRLLFNRNHLLFACWIQILIIDEAHNLSDTLSCIHSVELTGAQVLTHTLSLTWLACLH